MLEDGLEFEKEKMSPVIPIVTAILISLFVVGFAYRVLAVVV